MGTSGSLTRKQRVDLFFKSIGIPESLPSYVMNSSEYEPGLNPGEVRRIEYIPVEEVEENVEINYTEIKSSATLESTNKESTNEKFLIEVEYTDDDLKLVLGENIGMPCTGFIRDVYMAACEYGIIIDTVTLDRISPFVRDLIEDREVADSEDIRESNDSSGQPLKEDPLLHNEFPLGSE